MKYLKKFESAYEDLTPYTYGRSRNINSVNIGWLDSPDFPKGDVDKNLVEKIKRSEVISQYKGFHRCPFCDDRTARSSRDMQIVGKDKTYVFPALLPHYIEVHKYLPPKEFLDAVSQQ